jgi:lambda family phage portal protein
MARQPTGNPVGRPRKTAAQTAPTVTSTSDTQKHKQRYDAGGHGRRMQGWITPSSGPNKAITGIQKIRDRARDVSRNDWAGESGTQKWQTTLIGIGIVPRFKRIKSAARREYITDLFTDFVAQSDADCVQNLFGQQTLVVGTWFEGGEAFARRRNRNVFEDLAVPMQVQIYEADQCPMLDSTSWPGMGVGNSIKSGIEVNRIGRRVAYWFYKEHPGDGYQGRINPQDLVRVPASEVRHIFKPRRPGQMRGVSELAAVLMRLRNVGDFDDATLERQKIANLFMAFIKQTLAVEDRIDPSTGKLIVVDDEDVPIAPLLPGTTQELGPGQEMQFANPPEAGTTYSEYMRTQHMGTAAAAGIPYELFSGDIKEISDRTLRVLMNEFRRLAEQRQWQIIIPMFCQPVVEWFADAAFLVGKITEEERDLVKRCEHAPHGWAHIHPVQDPQGKKLEVEAGFRSRSSVIGDRGDDPDAVDAERAADMAREKQLDLWVDPAAAAGAKKTGDDDGIDDNEYPAGAPTPKK